MNSAGDVGLLPQSTSISNTPHFSPSQLNAKTMIINNPSSNNDSPEPSNVKWTKINDVSTSQSLQPRPRHGHRAVAYGNYMIVFGGGNEGIVEELHVFDTSKHEWFQPQMKGEVPPGCAAYGLVLDGCRMLLYGGMIEYGRYSNDLHELNIPRWEWKRLKPKPPRTGIPPCARLGHSFTIIKDQVFLFGGLANDSDDLKNNIPRYLNDMYTLQVRLNNEHGAWDIPVTFGSPPGPRESHTAVAYVSKDNRFNKLIVYGGMSGCRLGDLYILDVDTLMWCKPEVGGATPSPRSLHTSTLVGEKMYVFGGWVPMLVEELKNSEKEWKCTNSLACLNVETLTWENLHQDILDEKVPRARAGHSAVVINTRIYVWSGRDGYRKAWNNQVCCKDLWQLEVQKPADPGKVQLLRAGTNWLEVGWNPVPGADSYVLQCVAYEVPSDPVYPSDSSSAQPPLQSLAAAGYAPTPPIMTPVPTSKPAKSVVPPVKESPTIPMAAASTPSLGSPAQGISGVGTPPATLSQQSGNATHTNAPLQIVQASLPSIVSQPSQSITTNSIPAQVAVSVQQQQQESSTAPGSSVITLSMPSLSASPATIASDTSTVAAIVSSASGNQAVLPSASGLYTLPANVAGTASALLASKTINRSTPTPITTAQSAGRGVLRLRTPVQMAQTRTPGTMVTNLPAGATILKSPQANSVLASNASEATSAQLSGMHALAAAAASTQKMQTPQQTVKVVQQSPGQPQMFSQVKVANVGGVLPAGVRLGSPVGAGKPTASTSNVKQIIVQKPGTPGSGNQIYTVVKTSQGMALANLQGSKVIQGKAGVTATNVVPASSIQGSPQKTANIIKWVAAPGAGVATASKPNIISNQPILGLAGQGTSSSAPTPTYIISKPATTLSNRGQTPQYVVVTQASTIRSIQGMASNSLAGSQTITLPTSAATVGGQPQGVKMIVMPSASGAGSAGQSVKIITPGGMQTGSAPKTVTLATSKPTQYITSTGQIVTLPHGLLQQGSQQINIGGKQVTLQMPGGQKLAILSNSSGQIIQTSQSPGDVGKPKYVMVGSPKGTLPTSTPMRISMGGMFQPDSTTPSTSMGSDSVGAAAEGLVEMAGGTVDGSMMDQQGLNGVDGEQGGLKGGNMYGPWSKFCFSGLPWMKLKGGGKMQEKDAFGNYFSNVTRDSTIPIYSVNTKFSWTSVFGLKGGSDGNGSGNNSNNTAQDSQSVAEEETQRLDSSSEPMDTTEAPETSTSQPMQMQSESQQADSSTASVHVANDLANENTQVMENLSELSTPDTTAETQSESTEASSEAEPVILAKPEMMSSENVNNSSAPTVNDASDSQATQVVTQAAESSQVTETGDATQVPISQEELLTPAMAESLATASITFELQPPTSDGTMGAISSGGLTSEQPIAVIPITTSVSSSSDETMVMSFSIPTQSLLDNAASQPQQLVSEAEQTSQLNTMQLLAQQAAAQQPAQQVPQERQISQLTFTTHNQQLVLQQPQTTVSQQQQPISQLQQPMTQLQQPVSQLQQQSIAVTQHQLNQPVAESASLRQPVVRAPAHSTVPSVSLAPSFMIPVGSGPIVSQGGVANIMSGATLSSSQSLIMQGSPVAVQSPTSTISSNMASTPMIPPAGMPVSIGASAGSIVMSVSGAAPQLNASPQPAESRMTAPSPSVNRGQEAETRMTNNAQSSASQITKTATNGQNVATLQTRNANIVEEKTEKWMDVVHTKNTSHVVKCFFTTNEKLSKMEPDLPVDKDLEFIKKKIELKPATAYKFRVAAINTCGKGPWGEVTAFKTCLPGFPGAPSSIKISKSVDGATIAWEPPLNTPGDILEYSVYLAVKPPANAPEPKPGVTNLSFVRVYCGPSNSCNVPTVSLNQALVDTTSKPAIIFRIAAKNDKGYGPATQVRWLQESTAPSFVNQKSGILKRAAPYAGGAANKRSRDGN